EAARTKYDGVAYFFRAYFYYVKVRRYGDVPWYDTVIGSEEEELLKKPREDRGIIMDHVMSDLDDAIDMLPRDKDVARVTRWAALAFKSRAALYEGTWRKYRGLPDADKYLQQAADAAATFIAESGYSLYKEGTEPYRDLFCSDDAKQDEVILARLYNFEGLNLAHSVQFNIRNAATGFTRRFMNHYLMADGSRFTEKEGHETMFYTEETAGRDPRMAQTVLCPGYVAKGESAATPNDMTAMTGYEPIKFVSTAAHSGASKGTSDWPLFRTAEVYLNYAEAKAELGTLTQDDLTVSIDKIRERAGMGGLDMEAANADPDPFLLACYPNVTKSANTGVILEIRRERTVEMVMEGQRMWDMFRWKEGAQMVNETAPYHGIYFPGPGLYDMDGDGKNDLELYATQQTSTPADGLTVLKIGSDIILSEAADNRGYVVAWNALKYTWNEERDYLWPIPADQRVLTGGLLTQNPGWTDSTNFD
ncbi:MAG: RagB/SusD family nutrient uptake outer membrane protein, partial [Alistipes dispar]